MSRTERKAAYGRRREGAGEGRPPPKEPEKVEKLLDLDTMELEVGYGLVRLVDAAKGGDLLDRISMIRRQIAIELGIIVPPVRIRDNMQLGANDYAIKIKGQAVARGETYPEQFLAMDNGATSGPIPGGDADDRAGVRPAGLLGHRIRSGRRPRCSTTPSSRRPPCWPRT